jgi:HEAT repeat protein
MSLFKPNAGKLLSDGDTNGLLKALRNKDPQVREAAAEALGALGDPQAFETLLRVMAGDPEPAVRGQAAKALGMLGDRRAVDPLLEALSQGRVGASWAAPALGALGDKKAVEPLHATLEDLDRQFQEERDDAEGRRASGSAIETLETNLSFLSELGYRKNRGAVLAALTELGGRKAERSVTKPRRSLAQRLPSTSDGSAHDHVESVRERTDDEAAYEELAEDAGFSAKDVRRGAVIRYWWPYHGPEDSFIYHTYDLFDSDLKLIDQKVEPEDIRG